ncbi:pheromone-dependent cell cycle arrest protein Far11 [Trichophyton equinum CBS 127.97]|uniref:Pheromone-dependent cell cycle arrest protein Far11 n=1 Tax=Trichophyton equinum (strain ATCC MYA-4606 / CBS 127.97) TaxID=559882 RepID=F2Q009_TRIEC|nr:pheromone-dependent cell cycle arrest protein Far11 [Trichophyton equinum CBS 127.97]
MEPLENSEQEGLVEEPIMRADEVDNIGVDITTSTKEPVVAADTVSDVKLPEDREAKVDEADGLGDASVLQRLSQPSTRPELRRDRVAPPPPLQPPPPAPVQNPETQTDSVSLAQLRKIVQDLPKADLPSYAFKYDDCQPFPEEINEWFGDNEPDKLMLLGCKTTFEQTWSSFCQALPDVSESEPSWLSATDEDKEAFIEKMIGLFTSTDIFSRIEALESIAYTLTGVWVSTAGKVAGDYPSDITDHDAAETPKERSMQIQWMIKNAHTFLECQGIEALFTYLQRFFNKDQALVQEDMKAFANENGTTAYVATRDREINLILTCLYIIVEVARREEKLEYSSLELRDAFAALNPNLPATLVEIVARLRWDDPSIFPLTRVLLLFWKSILLLFGGIEPLKRAKTILEPMHVPTGSGQNESSNIPTLTASPLDYHLFRQEIISKYPAYNPPPPLVPFELEHNSVLPPLPASSSRNSSSVLFSGVGSTLANNNDSILHQSVHIATPAPSPPPSPGGPGKMGKKQNYQTNQHFPFMYPPLDGSSNNIGGKGTSDLQDSLVGRKWEGSDVPASIIEAGELFSSRMRMTRALEQLWEEREAFMKYDRGWDERAPDSGYRRPSDGHESGSPADQETKPRRQTEDEDVQRRLDEVEKFYVHALPSLQSFVIVVLKELLTSITAIASQTNGNDDIDGRADNALNGQKPSSNKSRILEPFLSTKQLQEARTREIRFEAISGALILLLKWFKRCHILKFEYLSQILLDSNYIPLILKMFIHQEVDHAVAQPQDPLVSSFFHFCHVHSNQPPEPIPPLEPTEIADDSSEDEAAPPPILRQSRSRISMLEEVSTKSAATEQIKENSRFLEVDELGFPTAPIEPGPISTYSFRNFFSAINFLHIMHKITHDKAHRCLLLVQYKCSAVLRKGLKIPDPHLRLYTLKLFKSQVPYCGRKWRLSHMRVITAIYLYCRPELRDDWLAGGDVDAEVEESLPMEQALRGLTHWWHVRQYKDVLSTENGKPLVEEERDFFTRELEKIGWGWFGEELNDGVDDEGEFVPHIGGGPELEKAIQMEAW